MSEEARKEMSGKLDFLIKNTERMKEVQRIQFDYFKHLTTLSVGALGVIGALVLKAFSEHKGTAWLFISILGFFICLLGSIWVLSAPGNAILYVIGIQLYAEASPEYPLKHKDKAEKAADQYNGALKQIHFFDMLTRIAFLVGVVAFMVFVGLNL